MSECPPGVHSMFDFCPGDCTEPVEDEHETFRVNWPTSIAEVVRWLHAHRAWYGPMALTDPLFRWGVFQGVPPPFAFEPGDTLCWDGTRVRLHSSPRQGVETCESQEALMLKFGTGQITAVSDGTEEKLPSKVGRVLTQEEWEAVVNEIGPETEGE